MCLQEGQVDLGRKMEKFSGRVVILEGVLQHLSGVREDGGDVQASLVAISQAFQALQVEVDKLSEGGGSWDGRLACLEREGEVGWERLGHLGNAMVAMTEEVKKLDKGYDAMRGGWLETNRLVSGLRVGQLQLEAGRPRVGLPFPRPSGGPDAPPPLKEACTLVCGVEGRRCLDYTVRCNFWSSGWRRRPPPGMWP